MQNRGSLALDLPLRVVVWQESDGTVWAGYHDVAALAAGYGVTGADATIDAMRSGLEAAVKYATAPY
jgi:uncharacterized protein (DUF302 family)